MLGGRIGRNFKYTPTGALTDFAATGCGGRVRINFVRSDLLLWTTSAKPHHRVDPEGPVALHQDADRRGRHQDLPLLLVSEPQPLLDLFRRHHHPFLLLS